MRGRGVVAGAIAIALGVGGSTAAAAPSATYRLSADRSKLAFNKTTIRAKAGSVTLRMSNPSNIPHDIGIRGRGTGRVVGKGGVSTFTVRLRRGTYTFYCSVGSHSRTMKGKLIVS